MPSLSKVFIIGHLGRDPEIKYLPSGDPVCEFSIAVSEKWKDKDGNKHERANWFNVVVFGKSAEFCGQYLAKGQAIHIEGKLREEKWETDDGQKRSSIKIIAQNVTTLGRKADMPEDKESQGKVPF